MAPFAKFGFISDGGGLLVAILIGIAFGFVLERCGFGSSRKLAAQFYFTDLTVFKVMFTAIVTAMLGLFWFSWLGVLDLSQVYVLPTYLVPQVVGGLIFGVGFIVGGYCPGTSCVAAATGKKDGWMLLLGMIAGIALFGELYPFLEGFYQSTSMGQITLPDVFHVSYGAVVFGVVLMALAGFAGAEWLEKWAASKSSPKDGSVSLPKVTA